MQNDKIINSLKKELKVKRDKQYANKWNEELTRHGLKWMGVRVPDTRDLAKMKFKELTSLNKKQIFKLCEDLLKENIFELKIIAFSWSFKMKKDFTTEDFKIFNRWVKKYISNWSDCDDFCTHTMGYFLLQFPEHLPEVQKWSKSKKMAGAQKCCCGLNLRNQKRALCA